MKGRERNQACPCGSGKKYRNCHGASHTRVLLMDEGAMRLSELLLTGGGYQRVSHLTRQLFQISFGHLKDTRLDQIEGAKVLQNHLTLLEENIRLIASNRSRYFWFFWAKCIVPHPGSSQEFIERRGSLDRITFHTAILKYGLPGIDDLVLDHHGANSRFDPQRTTGQDAIQLLQLHALSLEYAAMAACLRSLWKGEGLQITDRKVQVWFEDDISWELIRSYDVRQDAYGGLLGNFGSTALSRAEPMSDNNRSLLVPVPNFTRKRGEFFLPWEKPDKLPYALPSPYIPNYVLAKIGIESYLTKLNLFASEIEREYGVTPAQIVAFLYTLSTCNLDRIKESIRYRYYLFQRGHAVIDSQMFISNVSAAYPSVFKSLFGKSDGAGAYPVVETLSRRLTYDDTDFSQLSLWDQRYIKPLIVIGENLIVDFSAIPFILPFFVERLKSQGGEIGNIKGRSFEDELMSFLRNNLGDVKFWKCGQTIKTDKGTREIDAAVIYNSLLIIIECKARSVSRMLDRGLPDAVAGRVRVMDHDLEKLEMISRYLSDNPAQLDPEISHVMSLVCTPSPEYIPSPDPRYWLTDKIPRVCTPTEIVNYLKTLNPATYSQTCFVHRVKRS
jgi:hypothetical protein